MFFGKLWVRIKGELLALKEDDSVTEDLRARAGRLLDHVQERVTGAQERDRVTGVSDGEPSAEAHGEATRRTRAELADIEEQWRKMADERDRQKNSDRNDQPLPPNPRQLG